ncbi:MAG: bifunctional glutamate N-acetyltransferase/amino-acid acetyltransferase ArgJ [Oscillospiraceae bacterium]|nr:bifunctional glutamate N-acetyltransferase/amino-acid acetyltransferase ArgJ [Oscillospiraceae bacterium]
MNINYIPGGVCAPQGFTAAGIHCGLRKNKNKMDLAMIFSEKPCAAAVVSTKNKIKSGSLLQTLENLSGNTAQAVICNSVNANVYNSGSLDNAKRICSRTAAELLLEPSDVIVASTGVIGQDMNTEVILNSIPVLASSLSGSGSPDAARAIQTTDITLKEYAVEFMAGGVKQRIGAIAKGAGMIHPNMATMLCFITTDADIEVSALQKALTCACDITFNMISVDGDSSTNDMVSIMANGESGGTCLTVDSEDYRTFLHALVKVTRYLARAIAADGEGATRLLECTVIGAPGSTVAKSAARAVISSNLLKSAMFGSDANWGRVLMALGNSEGCFNTDRISISFKSAAGSIDVCENGTGKIFDETKAYEILREKEIKIIVDLQDGTHRATAWGCDLTYEYVKINGEYRS